MRIDDAIEIRKPEPDSHFRLKNCRCCGGSNVAYVKYLDEGAELWRAECFDCGYLPETGGTIVRHEAQVRWNLGTAAARATVGVTV